MNAIKSSTNTHIPVMLHDVLSVITHQESLEGTPIYIDATFGGGGYAKALLDSNKHAVVLAIDRDVSVFQGDVFNEIQNVYSERFFYMHGCFSNMKKYFNYFKNKDIMKNGILKAVVMDIGVSSMQLTQQGRGFSFQKDEPLDMRMDQNDKDTATAADILNKADERLLIDIFLFYGQERFSKIIASSIVQQRKKTPILTTFDLNRCIYHAVPHIVRKTHPATRIFQALRIFVNNELERFLYGIEAAKNLLQLGGLIVGVTFHSLEDKILKHFFYHNACAGFLELITKKPYTPSTFEISKNPKARSAKLRAAKKIFHHDHEQLTSTISNIYIPNIPTSILKNKIAF